MREMFYKILARFQSEKGQDLIEYALVTALLSVGIITGLIVTPLGAAFTTWVNSVATAING